MRHTHATLEPQAGIHPKVVSERLGHATVSITLDTYSHAIPAMQEEALIAGLVFAEAEGAEQGEWSVLGATASARTSHTRRALGNEVLKFRLRLRHPRAT